MKDREKEVIINLSYTYATHIEFYKNTCLLFRTPEQFPSVVSLLAESYNPYVRCGAAMALGLACAGTGNKV